MSVQRNSAKYMGTKTNLRPDMKKTVIALVMTVLLVMSSLVRLNAQNVQPADEFILTLEVAPEEGGTATGGGSYAAGTQITLNASTAEGFVFGQWSDELGNLLTKDTQFLFTMPAEDITLTAVFQCSPDWEEANGFQFNMQVIAHIVHEEGVSINPYDVLGAFVGDECRGLAYPQPEYDGLVFLTVGSNTQAGEKVELRIWNNGICEDCQAFQNFTFVNQSIIGSLDQPYEVECFEEAVLTLDFQQGYTWFSLNIIQNSMGVNDIFYDLEPCSNDRLIAQESFAVFYEDSWIGTLQEFNNEQMYRIRLCSSQSLPLIGARAPIIPYQLSAGYTWIGYLPQQCLPVNEALANLDPEPEFNDRIIGHNQFAVYTGTNWVGSLQQMCPGKGYIIKLSSNHTLLYPGTDQKNISTVSTATETLSLPWSTTMMLMGTLNYNGLSGSNDSILAFIDGRLRGKAAVPVSEDELFYMNIAGDEDELGKVNFFLKNDNSQVFPLNSIPISFAALSEAGDPEHPVLFEAYGNQETIPAQIRITSANPVIDRKISLEYDDTKGGQLHLQLINSQGKTVGKQIHFSAGSSTNLISMDVNGHAPGLYLLMAELRSEGKNQRKSFVVIIP
jgi:hypothetical protein